MTQMTSPEQESVEILTAIMGDDVSDPAEVARRVLRKCDGDVHKAATAILEGDRGEEINQGSASPNRTIEATRMPLYSPPPSRAGNNSPARVIDLTGDDDHADDISRALKASLETQSTTQFGPSERASHPNWAVVPSNTVGPSISHDDQAMDRAIQESLQGSYNDFADEAYEETPIEDRVRQGNRPIALRPTQATLTHAALLIQGLFFVPQVKLGMARFRPMDMVWSKEEDSLWVLAEIYTNMEVAIIAELSADVVLETFKAQEWNNPADHPGNLTRELYKKVTALVEGVFFKQFIDSGIPGPRPRLFHFLHGKIDDDPGKHPDEAELVTVTVGGNAAGENNDLMSCLSAQLSAPLDLPEQQEYIFEPSDVVTFELVSNSLRTSSQSTSFGGINERKAFRYPKHIYLDRFLQVNLGLSNAKRAQRREMDAELEKLFIRRKSLTSFDNKDTLKDLRASLFYYENVAEAKGDPGRQADIERTGDKLKKIMTGIEREIEEIDSRVAKLKNAAAALFDTPDLQRLRYDLRVVFIHDGIFGRKHLYSYVEDKGKWWKTCGNTVTEVTEDTVFTDPTGLHLGAGPYLLIYSKAMSAEHASELERLPWPEKIKDSVKHNNMQFLSQINPEVASQHAAESSDLLKQNQELMDTS